MVAEDIFTIETFVGLHIFLAAANLLYSLLDRFIRVVEEHLLGPLIDLLLGDCVDFMKWDLPTTNPEHDQWLLGPSLFIAPTRSHFRPGSDGLSDGLLFSRHQPNIGTRLKNLGKSRQRVHQHRERIGT